MQRREKVMYSKLFPLYVVSVAAAIGFAPAPAHASIILQDTYYGGHILELPDGRHRDPNTFNVQSAIIQRTNGGNTLQITINTNYAGKPGTPAADGTGYGALFITPGKDAWKPTGSGPNYFDDQYRPGEWAYAATIPQTPVKRPVRERSMTRLPGPWSWRTLTTIFRPIQTIQPHHSTSAPTKLCNLRRA